MLTGFYDEYKDDLLRPFNVRYLCRPVCIYYSQTSEEGDGMEAALNYYIILRGIFIFSGKGNYLKRSIKLITILGY